MENLKIKTFGGILRPFGQAIFTNSVLEWPHFKVFKLLVASDIEGPDSVWQAFRLLIQQPSNE